MIRLILISIDVTLFKVYFKAMKQLIIGYDSKIGKALYKYLRGKGEDVIGTTRRAGSVDGLLFLDMESPDLNFPLADSAVFCAGITSQQKCEEQPGFTRLINVENTLRVAEALHRNGTFLVFLSSDKAISRACEYGRQKSDAEDGFISMGGAVVRLGKVITPDMPLFMKWIEGWENGLRAEAFSDLYFSPIDPDSVLSLIFNAVTRKIPGIFGISASAISYYEAALIGARTLGFSENLVKPTHVPKEMSNFLSPNVRDELGGAELSSSEIIENFFSRYK